MNTAKEYVAQANRQYIEAIEAIHLPLPYTTSTMLYVCMKLTHAQMSLIHAIEVDTFSPFNADWLGMIKAIRTLINNL